jgi:hypothetical protein
VGDKFVFKMWKGEKRGLQETSASPQPPSPQKNMTMHATVPHTHMNFVILMLIFILQEHKQLVQNAK